MEPNKQKKVETSLMIYDYLILQHTVMKIILEKKYEMLINTIIYDKFIIQFPKRRYSQYALVALVRSGMVLANQEFLLAFIVRRNNWRKKTSLTEKTKKNKKKNTSSKEKLAIMQIPTSEAIREQVSEELDEQLPGQVLDLVGESALRPSSKRKRRA